MILCIALTAAVTMILNEIQFVEIAYGLMLCFFITIVAIVVGFCRHYSSFRQLERMQENIVVESDVMKTPEYMYEGQYQNCIRTLANENNRIRNEMLNRQQDMTEYYSMWVHQVKTPIAALKLLIDEDMAVYVESENTDEDDTRVINEKQKRNELFRIEEYIDMALQYTRLGAQTNDFVIERILLDGVIKNSIHKYAKQFIYKKLRLNYEPKEIMAVTDKKWLGFVIDQLLSNAIKYTKQGSITIRAEQITDTSSESASIIIQDTGMGISAEDIPRICENGYTGYNGHSEKHSTGIGLYLCKEILDKLGHRISVTSEIGRGTRVEISNICL